MELDRDGFRHREAELAPAIGAERIDATVYEAVAERPIWPYHYHYGIEDCELGSLGRWPSSPPARSSPSPKPSAGPHHKTNPTACNVRNPG